MFQAARPRYARRYQLLIRNYYIYLQGRSNKPWVERWGGEVFIISSNI
jgi:hypothetical protein